MGKAIHQFIILMYCDENLAKNNYNNSIDQAPVVRKLDGAIDRINHYPVDKY